MTSVGAATILSSRQPGADRLDLFRGAGNGVPRQPYAVLARLVLESRDDVKVDVENGLPGGLPTAVEEVDAVGPEAVLGSLGDPLGELGAGSEILGGDVKHVDRV